jgi:hypothetical protein
MKVVTPSDVFLARRDAFPAVLRGRGRADHLGPGRENPLPLFLFDDAA